MALILDGTNGLSDVDGSAATPAIRGSDANTGVFFGTDIVGLSTGGSERMRVDASGNVGIGTSTPFVRLQATGTIKVATGNAQGILSLGDGGGASVNCGVWRGAANAPTTDGNFLNFGGYDGLVFATGNAVIGSQTERARISDSGNFLVGTTSNLGSGLVGIRRASLFFNGDCLALQDGNSTTGGAFVSFKNESGTNIGTISRNGASSVAYNTSSDYRLKENIAPMTGALARISALNPVTYTWKADGSADEGFIAHELAEVCPAAVTGAKDAVEVVDVKDEEGNVIGTEERPVYQGIDTSFLVATLTAAIQEQQAIITALTARVEALEGAQA